MKIATALERDPAIYHADSTHRPHRNAGARSAWKRRGGRAATALASSIALLCACALGGADQAMASPGHRPTWRPGSGPGVAWQTDGPHLLASLALQPFVLAIVVPMALLLLLRGRRRTATILHSETRPAPLRSAPGESGRHRTNKPRTDSHRPLANDHPSVGRRDALIMGRPTVSGASTDHSRRALDLVMLLALDSHHHSPADVLRGRLGDSPDTPLRESEFRELCDQTQVWLGQASDRQPMLLPTAGGYALHPELSVDWDRFQTLIDGGEPEELRQGLALVRGEPMESCDYWWLDMVTVESVRARVTEVAEHLTLIELQQGRPDRAIWAASRGIMADPHAETLYRLMMRAEADTGNAYGIHQTYQRCVRKLNDIGSAPDPSTATLYRQLAQGSTDGTGPAACQLAA